MKRNLAVRERLERDDEMAVIAERVEQQAWGDIAEAATPQLRALTGVQAQERDGALMLAAPGLKHLLFNRVIGLGREMPATDAQIRTVIEKYAALGISSYWVHCCPYALPVRLGRHLQLHGLQPYRRSWVKLLSYVRAMPIAPSAVHVRLAAPTDAPVIASIVGPSFDMPQRGAELLTTLIGRPRWRVFVAVKQDQVIAAAGSFTSDGVAYLAFAATRPEWRSYGAQQALINERMNAAAQDGCRWIASETGFPLLADEISPSYHNMLKAGFRPVSIRDNYAPPGTQWHVGTVHD
jgi:ribosomal protein S18 acetylase RimI-like enzyme